jgi:hypothetical protein
MDLLYKNNTKKHFQENLLLPALMVIYPKPLQPQQDFSHNNNKLNNTM